MAELWRPRARRRRPGLSSTAPTSLRLSGSRASGSARTSRTSTCTRPFCILTGGSGPRRGSDRCARTWLPSSRAAASRDVRGAGVRHHAPAGDPRHLLGLHPAPWEEPGLTWATQVAVPPLIVAARLRSTHQRLHYRRGGLVAHECILDVRPLTSGQWGSPSTTRQTLTSTTASRLTMSFLSPTPWSSRPRARISDLDRFATR